MFCLQSQSENVKLALKNSGVDAKIVLFDGGDMESFVAQNKGTERGFK